jgi:hypothetical protein
MESEIVRPGPSAPDDEFFQKLRGDVEHQISTYIYEVAEGSLGNPLSAEQIRSYLKAMQVRLVHPRWEIVEIRNTVEEVRTGEGTKRNCVTLAEDRDYVLVFDPVDEQHHLAFRSEYGLATWGISGDAVGCFIAR